MFEKFLDKIDKLDEDENKKKDDNYKKKREKEAESFNIIGIVLQVLSGLIAIIGTIIGIITFAEGGLIIIVSSLLSALFIRALAEIINLLQKINDKL